MTPSLHLPVPGRVARGLLGLCCAAATACGSLLVPPRVQPLEESVVLGERGPKVVQLEVEGLISEARPATRLSLVPRDSFLGRLRESLDRAARDPDVAALLLRIQSPGGTVSASETLYEQVRRWKQETGRPVVAHLGGLATSGAYYVAMAADEVIAHPTTVTGSIGVIFAGLNLSGLMDKLGIANQTLTGGEFKDAGSPLRPMRDVERAHLQSVIDDFHDRFRTVVAGGRPGLSAEQVASAADGRIFSSDQALELGLVDSIGYLEDAAKAAAARAGADDTRVVVYHRPSEYRNNLYSRPEAPSAPFVNVDLLPQLGSPLAPGFYFLWPAVLGGP